MENCINFKSLLTRWESESAATPMGQLAYFIEFLTLTGLWSRWQESCPLSYTSPNAPDKADVLGTWMLSVLAGHKRYSHVTAIRCDGVNPGLLGMNKVISEDALRNALKRIPQAEGCAWLDGHLSGSVAPLLDVAWILDIDTTVKPLYGKQEGAVISYNPKKPGRPSHTYHTYLMAALRQVLGVEVHGGNEHAARHTQPGLLKILDDLPEERKPAPAPGSCAARAGVAVRAMPVSNAEPMAAGAASPTPRSTPAPTCSCSQRPPRHFRSRRRCWSRRSPRPNRCG